jgi:transcriptional regulator with XRE-family HTH domain
MTPKQLRQLREARGLTRDELAAELGCSAGAIVQWEHGKRTIPGWVEERMMRAIPVTLPLADLAAFLDHCRARDLDFHTALSEALTDWLITQTGQSVTPKPSVTYTDLPPLHAKAVEEPPPSSADQRKPA